MINQGHAKWVELMKEFFDRATACLAEEDSTFAPTDEMMTAAQQVAHVAHTVDWFIEGAFGDGNGFDMDFAGAAAKIKAVTSLSAARKMLDDAFERAVEVVGNTSMEDMMSKMLPDGPIMGGLPMVAVVSGIDEHTAHHRGALSVYARLCGKVPAMPYGDIE